MLTKKIRLYHKDKNIIEYIDYQYEGKLNITKIKNQYPNAIVMLPTKYKDRYGKVIYQGDMVKYKVWYPLTISYGNIKSYDFKIPTNLIDRLQNNYIECIGTVYFNSKKHKDMVVGEYNPISKLCDVEVIGTVYDNFELKNIK